MSKLALALILVVSQGAAQTQRYDLLWKPKAAQTLPYKLNMELDVSGRKVLFTSELFLKVLKVENNGDYELETSTRNTKLKVGDQDFPAENAVPKVERYSLRGDRISPLEEEGDQDPLSAILGPVTDFSPPAEPVLKGAKWMRDVPGDAAKKRIGTHSEYELVGPEKLGDKNVLRVKYSFAQVKIDNPVTATGSFLLDPADFAVTSFESVVKNFKMDTETPPGMVVIRMVRA